MSALSPGGQAVTAAGQVAAVCRAAARLIAAGLSEATASAAPAGGRPARAGAISPAREQGGAAPPAATPGAGADPPADRFAVITKLAGGTPTEGVGVAAIAVGVILLVLSALTVHGLVGDRAAPHRRRSVLESARAARQDLRARGEILPALVLVVVSLALWSAIALWVVTR